MYAFDFNLATERVPSLLRAFDNTVVLDPTDIFQTCSPLGEVTPSAK